jgi:hypothetical protein
MAHEGPTRDADQSNRTSWHFPCLDIHRSVVVPGRMTLALSQKMCDFESSGKMLHQVRE